MKRKVLLMGRSESGKTSMRSIIFANYIARDTMRLGVTIDVEHSHVRFLGNLVLNLWDCGGQEGFVESYLTTQRDHIFRNVEVLIYVFDIESREHQKDLKNFKSCLEAIKQNSNDAKIFCLIHKMDLVPEDQRDSLFKQREAELKQLSLPLKVTCFRTSIWDETLYKAWSSIVYSLIPNVKVLEHHLDKFCKICEADEVVLFEKATFLVISHSDRKQHNDVHRFEKISTIIKQFFLSCSKSQANFQAMEVRNSNFAAFIDAFTSNTYIMVIMSDPTIESSATLLNIQVAKSHFEKFIQQNSTSSVFVKSVILYLLVKTKTMELRENFTIGYYMSVSKLEKMKWNQFVQLAWDKYKIKCIPIDLETNNLPSVCPYDVVIHKFTDELSDPNDNENTKTIISIENILKKYPSLVEVDPLQCQKPVLDRVTLSNLLDKLNQLPANFNVKCPSFVVINEEQADYSEQLKSIRFPIVCKTVQACGSEESHQMAIFFDEPSLRQSKFKPPMLIQEYINHNAIIYKVFVVGDYLNVVHRKSLRNMNSNESEALYFDSQQPLPATLLPEKPYDESMVEIPPRDTLVAISKQIQKDLGLTLFGFDVITDISTKKSAIVDLNYFPGYIGIPDFNSILLDHILNVYKEKKQH
ncbi:Ras-related GTP-binding protein [Heterostelium album PN500]|uniref:inositol-1,3,4-trisphosphate 5/6-kinase n=1 Tax=Heterostelium pallidum (strain ATCC 26659 / Pp 5 / PN500) TaxID=670386 RepID=D3BC27_HETP5|nr:Ras-related GTP-binding protein [Heterostelium album PN500]EFA81210.1 Ras-related GTP-binding protein [Heterostelium album PN500]|eukprot:XP_020433328.1 Ras-related GTP-binding protein [Heterostelium album PN500]